MRTYLDNDTVNPEVKIHEVFGDERVFVEPEAAVGHSDDVEHGVVGRTENDGGHDDRGDRDPGTRQSADPRSDRRMTDGEVAEHR